MSPIKEAAIKLIESLPEDCTWQDIRYRFYVRERIESGLKAAEEGYVLSEDEADERITDWLDSLGPNQP